MKIRRILAALAIVAALGMLASGCGQSNEQMETSSCPGSKDSKGCDMECAVTCSGAEGTSEYVVTCAGHDGDGEKTCTVTCTGAEGEKTCTVTCDGTEGEKTCTVTCDGTEGEKTCTVTCDGTEGEKTCTVTCDDKTMTCEHADGEECTCAPVSMSGCPGAKVSGTCPMSAAAKDEGTTK